MKERLMLIALVLIGVLATYELATFRRVEVAPRSVPRHFTPPVLEVADGPVFAWPIHEDDYIALSSPYGERDPETVGGDVSDFHSGLDLFGTWHARIVSISDGVVLEHYPPPDNWWKGHPVLGGYLRIGHYDGTEAVYAHLSSTEVHEGDTVKRGQYIGRQGNTGISDGEHLHIEIRIGGNLVNPLQYIKEPRSKS